MTGSIMKYERVLRKYFTHFMQPIHFALVCSGVTNKNTKYRNRSNNSQIICFSRKTKQLLLAALEQTYKFLDVL